MKNFISTNSSIKNLNNITTFDEYVKTYVDNLRYMGLDAFYEENCYGKGSIYIKRNDEEPIILVYHSTLLELFDEQLKKISNAIENKNRQLIYNILSDMHIVRTGDIVDHDDVLDIDYSVLHKFYLDADGWRDHIFVTDINDITPQVILGCILNDVEHGLWGVDLRVTSVQKIMRYISAFMYNGDAASYIIRTRNEIKKQNIVNDLSDMEEVFQS